VSLSDAALAILEAVARDGGLICLPFSVPGQARKNRPILRAQLALDRFAHRLTHDLGRRQPQVGRPGRLERQGEVRETQAQLEAGFKTVVRNPRAVTLVVRLANMVLVTSTAATTRW
jgi:hypothetical protein